MISEEVMDKAKHEAMKVATEWKIRKRGCMEIIDAICEGADLNRKDFMVIFKNTF